MQKSEPGELIYKTVENQPASAAAETSDGLLSDAVIACIADCMADLTAGYEKQVGELRRQVDQLTGKVDTLLTLLQGTTKADVVQLQSRKHG